MQFAEGSGGVLKEVEEEREVSGGEALTANSCTLAVHLVCTVCLMLLLLSLLTASAFLP